MNYLYIGCSPTNEPCAQVGSDDYLRRARIECEAFINQLKREFPDGVFEIKIEEHDFGSHLQVIALMEDEKSGEAAYQAEKNTPLHWTEEARFEIDRRMNSVLDEEEEQDYAESLSEDELVSMMFDGKVICADGCAVEPDGTCPHGYRSPLLILGII